MRPDDQMAGVEDLVPPDAMERLAAALGGTYRPRKTWHKAEPEPEPEGDD